MRLCWRSGRTYALVARTSRPAVEPWQALWSFFRSTSLRLGARGASRRVRLPPALTVALLSIGRTRRSTPRACALKLMVIGDGGSEWRRGVAASRGSGESTARTAPPIWAEMAWRSGGQRPPSLAEPRRLDVASALRPRPRGPRGQQWFIFIQPDMTAVCKRTADTPLSNYLKVDTRLLHSRIDVN